MLAAERELVAADIAAVVRMHEETVRRWMVRYQAEGSKGLTDAPRPGTPPGATRVYVAWDNSGTHEEDEVEAVVRAPAGRLVLLYLPTYSPWLNPIEMLWRQFRHEVTHCELFANIHALLDATHDFFDRCNQKSGGLRSILCAHPA